ncbi:DUF6226 family protein [Agreia pratensis]|uniref:Uncharacterized protein n=1 Tax=Agreia pratensis TaxID=150121 RepID=A0A1X7IXK1_9MICO|nr:DUF6226 family protein [Agreia pratensis]SMG19802.1 hypothetical protein SAMN06296010_0994 [Agreia pratensis]
MIGYERPTLPVKVYLDETGRPIPYGSRWRGMSPPEDAYSRTANLDRFEPLQTVARALIDWLIVTFDVAVERNETVAADFERWIHDLETAVRITPRDPLAAPLTFAFTSFPGVVLHMGALFDSTFPACGCDACDDDVLWLVDQLEWTAQVVVNGGGSERIDAEPDGWFEYRLQNDAGMESARRRLGEVPVERVEAARGILPASGQWSAWPLRGA